MRAAASELQDQLDRGATHAFSPSFGIAALLGLLALLPIGLSRGGSSCERARRTLDARTLLGRLGRRLAGTGRRLPRRRRRLLRAGEDPGPLQAPALAQPGRTRTDRRAVHPLGPRRRRLPARGHAARTLARALATPRRANASASATTSPTTSWRGRSAPACCGRSTTPKKPARSARWSPAPLRETLAASRSTRRSNSSRTPAALLEQRRRLPRPRPGAARTVPSLSRVVG